MHDCDSEHHNCERLMREGQGKRRLMEQGQDTKGGLQRHCGGE
jgi:hypothetical protein